jgi:hypothetical protein
VKLNLHVVALKSRYLYYGRKLMRKMQMFIQQVLVPCVADISEKHAASISRGKCFIKITGTFLIHLHAEFQLIKMMDR